ncbi:MAG TPA: FecR domain-containing protein [Edaphobacter sp.]|nr:FecR domain-containing protein [Edaphobacter sp.]
MSLAVVALFSLGLTKAQADTHMRSARLSYLQGTVTIDHADNSGNSPAQLNMPLAQGFRITTGDDGEAELEFEDGSVVRLAPNSSLDLTNLTSNGNGNFQTELTLDSGLAYAELRASNSFLYQIDAGGVSISPVENTTVRIDKDQPQVAVSVFDGVAQVEHSNTGGAGYRTNVSAGQTLTEDASNPDLYTLNKGIAKNSWDQWNDDRDREEAQEASDNTDVRDQYAGDEGYGWSDLDANGSWYDVPGEGRVWQPYVAMDPAFDPYGFGSWTWYPGMGYVWASGYSWGWTPYRCGSWSYWNGFGWGWLPGAGCGFSGWGFGPGYGGYGGYGYGGGGYIINITRPPSWYRVKPVPVRSGGPIHPIKVGRPVTITSRPPSIPRRINGQVVQPLRPVPSTGVHPAGGALRRDFPTGRVYSRPIPKKGSTIPSQSPGTRPVMPRPQSGPAERSPQIRPQTQPQARPPMRPIQPPVQRRVNPQPEQRMPAPQPRYNPPPQPRYNPPPQPHYNPPPAAPHYSPPPAQSAPHSPARR